MTVKENESRKRSLSLCSMSDNMSQTGKTPGDKKDLQLPGEPKSPADLQRIKGTKVVLTPMGNENNINPGHINSIFRDSRRL